MTDEYDDPRKANLEELKASADGAKEKYEKEHRRSLEVRASFFDKLSALDAGSIAVAVSVGIALLGRPESRIGSVHSNLSWLAVIAFFLWVSLICAIGHNFIYVKISRLEAEQALAWSRFLALMSASVSAHAEGSPKSAEFVDQHILDTFTERIHASSMLATHTSTSVNRVMLLGWVAVTPFLLAYTLVFICVIRLWWLTR
jgi:ABC-type multidrug transport system fused ATPase/permease subunit